MANITLELLLVQLRCSVCAVVSARGNNKVSQCNGYGHNVGSQIISQKANIHYIHKMINLKQTCNMKNGDELQSGVWGWNASTKRKWIECNDIFDMNTLHVCVCAYRPAEHTRWWFKVLVLINSRTHPSAFGRHINLSICYIFYCYRVDLLHSVD